MHRVDRAVGRGGRRRRPQRRVGDAEARLFAFHVAARLQVAGGLIDAQRGKCGIAALFGATGHGKQRDEDDRHRRQHRPALPRVAHHLAEGVAQRGRDQQDRQHLDEVRQRRRILERMRRVDVEEAAAVGAQAA